MQTPVALYIATVLGGLALVLLMPKQRGNLRVLGTLLGAGALGGTWLFIAQRIDTLGGMQWNAFGYYYLFSAIAIVAAVRVITHTQPVYSALWFVLVVLASSGLLLVLGAEFMAFAMIIIYAGAILVTYMFVIMLASQSESPDAPAEGGGGAGAGRAGDPELSVTYDRFAREPFSAVVAGFLLLAVLLTVAFPPTPMQPNENAHAASDHDMIQDVLADRPEVSLEAQLERMLPGQEQLAAAGGAPSERLSNAERIGVDLFQQHPLGLELAGVILLVALIGAVVIARTRIPEEEPASTDRG